MQEGGSLVYIVFFKSSSEFQRHSFWACALICHNQKTCSNNVPSSKSQLQTSHRPCKVATNLPLKLLLCIKPISVSLSQLSSPKPNSFILWFFVCIKKRSATLCSLTLSNLIIYKTQFFFPCLSLDKKRSGKLHFSVPLKSFLQNSILFLSFLYKKQDLLCSLCCSCCCLLKFLLYLLPLLHSNTPDT